jgi:hypothetical protein
MPRNSPKKIRTKAVKAAKRVAKKTPAKAKKALAR